MEKAHVQILSRFDLCLFRPVTDILCWFLHKCRQFFALCDRIYAWTIFYSCTPWLCFFRMPEQYKLNLDAVLVLLEKFHLKLRFDLIWFDLTVTCEQAKVFGRLFTFYMRCTKNYYTQFYRSVLPATSRWRNKNEKKSAFWTILGLETQSLGLSEWLLKSCLKYTSLRTKLI